MDGTKRLIAEATEGSVAHQPPTERLKTATWRLATDVVARTANTETRIAVVERVAHRLCATPAQEALAWLHAKGPNVFPIPGSVNPAKSH